MPHGVVNFVNFSLLVGDGVVELIKVVDVSGPGFVLFDSVVLAVLKVVIEILDRLVTGELSSQGLVVIFEGLHVGFVPFIDFNSGETVSVVNGVFRVVLLYDLWDVLGEDWSILEFFGLFGSCQMKGYDFVIQILLSSFVVLKVLVFREYKEICASVHSRQTCNILLSFNSLNSVIIANERYVLSCPSF